MLPPCLLVALPNMFTFNYKSFLGLCVVGMPYIILCWHCWIYGIQTSTRISSVPWGVLIQASLSFCPQIHECSTHFYYEHIFYESTQQIWLLTVRKGRLYFQIVCLSTGVSSSEVGLPQGGRVCPQGSLPTGGLPLGSASRGSASTPVLTSSVGHCSGGYATYWNAFFSLIMNAWTSLNLKSLRITFMTDTVEIDCSTTVIKL